MNLPSFVLFTSGVLILSLEERRELDGREGLREEFREEWL